MILPLKHDPHPVAVTSLIRCPQCGSPGKIGGLAIWVWWEDPDTKVHHSYLLHEFCYKEATKDHPKKAPASSWGEHARAAQSDPGLTFPDDSVDGSNTGCQETPPATTKREKQKR